jgi:selenocysteine lyase/cysteine desulfurase
VDLAALRHEFPVLERLAYLNAGTDGPVPVAAVRAAREALEAQVGDGRFVPHFEARFALQDALRERYAQVLGCDDGDVALTTSTSHGIGAALAGMDLGPGDEIVTSDAEHPGLIGPLIAARRRGVAVKAVPLRAVADAVTARTTLVACSHVSWITGEVAPAALAELDVPVVLDGAHGAGAVPVDVRALGCAAYAASGQKWLCGADGTGMLYVEPAFRDRLRVVSPAYVNFEDAARGLESPLRADARRFDVPALSREGAAFSLAAVRTLHRAGLDAVHARGAELAGRLADALARRGRIVAPRDSTTLVAWEDPDPPAAAQRLAAAGVIVRHLPGRPLLRASVGAWNDEGDLERLLRAIEPTATRRGRP